MAVEQNEILKFMPFSSCINPSFWFELSRLKLDDYKLNDEYKSLFGFYNNYTNSDLPPIMNFDYTSFSSDKNSAENRTTQISVVPGQLKVYNTINEFNTADKNKILAEFGQTVWTDIKSGRVLEQTELLNQFCLITFANLKNYVFHYWFGFPAITFPGRNYILHKQQTIDELFSQEETDTFLSKLTKFQEAHANHAVGYFALNYETHDVMTLKAGIELLLKEPTKRVIFAFMDPNSHSKFASWPLRNYLALLSYHLSQKVRNVEVLSFRDRYKSGSRSIGNSLVFSIELLNVTEANETGVIGWEKNEKQQLAPRVVDMSESMNSEKLAESAVSLNLKLMKWRIAPSIDLDIVKGTKCLLLGSGTLGCNVARCLLAWGVEKITFVDNSKISYSNPVRQSLFNFSDSLNSAYKSTVAANNIKLIYPGVDANGIILSIPMPGHFVGDSTKKKIEQDVKQLEELIQSHDAVFLLMDTRESRWLPTLLASLHRKPVINAALGFDSFLVMRHGVKQEGASNISTNLMNTRVPGNLLGCYFCSDIVAPGNSTVDRTLDQQCTVSRPGLSMIASALAVELLISCLQHPLKHQAPSETNVQQNVDEEPHESSCLGLVPHQIRGYLHNFTNILPASQSFDKCTACSNKVLELYKAEGFDFLLKAFNDSAYLEDVSGLKDLKQAFDDNELELVIELSDTESN